LNAGGWLVGQHPRFLADVTGDGRADIVGFGADDVWVALSNGDGTFQPPIWGLGDLGYNSGWRVEKHPRFLADITGDGRADIVGFGDAGMWTALSNGAGGFSSLRLAIEGFTDWTDDQHPRFMTDITGDGHADMVGFNEQGMWTARSNGDGTFIYPGFAGEFGGSNSGWRAAEHPRFPVDLTGDGRADVIGFGNAGVWTTLGLGNGSFYPPTLALREFGAQSDATGIRHIFVLMLENRSFDHMLGFSGITGSDAETGQPTGINGLTGAETNDVDGITYPVTAGASNVMSHDPGHSFKATLDQLAGYGVEYPPGGPYPPIDNSGFATSYSVGDRNPAKVMDCFTDQQLPFLHQLAREFVVCDNWYGSMPGPTHPNRLFVHGATSGGLDHTPSWDQFTAWALTPGGGLKLSNGTIYDALDRAAGGNGWFGSSEYRVYAGDAFPMAATLDGISIVYDVEDFDDLAGHLGSGDLDKVKVIHIEPSYHHPSYAFWDDYAGGTSQHPIGDVRRGDLLIKQTYEAIRNSPLWDSSMLIITWDEHGGFYDHVAPPPAIPPGDPDYADDANERRFAFDQLGPRVPAVIVSPLIPKNVIDHRTYDHASIPATIERVFGLQPLTNRDLVARGIETLAVLSGPRSDTPITLTTPDTYEMPPALRTSGADRVTNPQRLVNNDDGITPFLYSALMQDLAISEPAEHPAIKTRAAAIRTRVDAADYLKDVATRVSAAKLSRPPRSTTRSSE
jgi:phospholipase C